MSSNVEKKRDKFPVFQQRFHELRGKLTQGEFAKKVGISRPSVGFYENGERVPDALVLAQISRECNVSTDWLLGLTNDKKGNPSGMAVEKYLGLEKEAQIKLRQLKGCIDGKYKHFPNAQIYKYHVNFINSFIASSKFDDVCGEMYSYQSALKTASAIEEKHSDIDFNTPYKDIPITAFANSETSNFKERQTKYILEDSIRKEYSNAKKDCKLHFFEAQRIFLDFLQNFTETNYVSE